MVKGGPKTESGKALARLNATQHGVLAKVPVVPGLERAEEWEAHRTATLASLSPEGHLENLLAERVALQLWRLHRVVRYEAGVITNAQETVDDDVAEARRQSRLFDTFRSDRITFDHPQEGAAKLRSRLQLARRLELLQETDEGEPLPGDEAEAVLYAVAAHARKVNIEKLPLPGVPDDAALSDLDDWTVGKVRQCIGAIATAAGTDVDKLLAFALRAESIEAVTLGREVERANAQVERKRNERLLPPVKTMENVARYEAHLSRELYRALHELEAMQARRQGQAAPLARVEVHGLPEN
jgi:hypothetical protein